MVQNLCQGLWKLRLVVVLTLSSLTTTFANAAFAQIVPDATLGSENSRLTNGNVRGLPAVLIEGGATRGVNLFQSFLQFNVGDGQRVYFGNPTGIENILTRVTGSDTSKIFGTLGVNGGANLFLLNPNGIVFGPNARLDIAGSFLASTANSFVFENGLKFSATNAEAAPLITVNLRPGLQYGNQVATLSNTGNLSAGQDLTLTGGNLDLQGRLQANRDLTLQATNTLKVRDSVANPFIAAAGGKLVVQGNQNVDIFALNHADSGFFAGGDILLRSANTVSGDAHYWAGGNFSIEQLNGELGNLFSPYDPIIRASGDVSFASYTGASLHILAGGSVTISGLVEITGADTRNGLSDTVTLSDGTQLNIDGQNTPTLDIRAGTTAFGEPGLTPPIRLFPGESNKIDGNINTNAPSTSADINIASIKNDFLNSVVLLTNRYKPNNTLPSASITTGPISAFGLVAIDARDDINTTGDINVSINSGTGGDIKLISTAGKINILGNTENNITITAGSGDGKAGNILLKAFGDITIENSKITSESKNETTDGFPVISLEATNGSVLLNKSTLSTTNTGSGLAGDIRINSLNNIKIENASNISSKGILGNIFIGGAELSPQTVTIDNSTLNIDNPQLTGSAGNISINAINNISIANSTLLSGATNNDINIDSLTGATTESTANAGNIFIGANGAVSIADNTTINSDVLLGKGNADQITGNAGQITIDAGSVSLTNGSELNTNNNGSGLAGNIDIIANNQNISIANSQITSESNNNQTPEQSPFIRLEATQGSVFLNQSRLSTTNLGSGLAGNIIISALNEISILNSNPDNPIFESTETGIFSQGNLGRIFIGKSDLYTQDLSPQTVTINNSELNSNVPTSATANAGQITINAGSISLANASKLLTDNNGSGLAGNIEIIANSQDISIANSQISSESNNETTDDFPVISLDATNGSVLLNQSTLSTTNFGSKLAGDIKINAFNEVKIENNSNIFSQGNFGRILIGSADLSPKTVTIANSRLNTDNNNIAESAGNISIDAIDKVSINTSDISSITKTSGTAGTVTIQSIQGSVDIGGSRITVETTAEGSGGDININTASLNLTNSQLQAQTRASGAAGNVLINKNAPTSNGLVSLDNSQIFSTIEPGGTGNGGKIDITAKSLFLRNGAQLQTLVRQANGELPAGQGQAGNIKLTVTDTIKLDGATTLISSELQPGTTGQGGSIDIDPNLVELTNGAKITVDSQGTGPAGDIILNSNLLTLNNKSAITSRANSGDGGNVTFNIRDLLLLQGNSQISTSSGVNGAGGNGGFITINAPNGFIVAPPLLGNSDITANAFLGSGGVVDITAKGVFGLRLLTRQQLQQELGTSDPIQLNPQNLPTNDITAISQTDPNLDGNVNVNSPDVDPSKSIVSLPENPSDPSKKITQGCRVGEFLNTGRGGLPTRPDDSLTSEAVWEDLRQTATTAQQPKSSERASTPTQENVVSIIPATGWIFNDKGEVTLISHTHQANSSPSWSNSSSCPVR